MENSFWSQRPAQLQTNIACPLLARWKNPHGVKANNISGSSEPNVENYWSEGQRNQTVMPRPPYRAHLWKTPDGVDNQSNLVDNVKRRNNAPCVENSSWQGRSHITMAHPPIG